MKNLLKAIACAIVILTCANCSVESTDTIQEDSLITQEETTDVEVPDVLCTSQDPQAILTNNSLLPADFEVFDQFGLLMTHSYGVAIGDSSPVLTFPDGVTTFIVSTSASSKEIKIDMGNCMVYEVAIDEFNHLDTDVPTQL
ncbi:hypothetical protein [Psychroserpens jangbogonensis]|uniref:hypothetical protein n=1 Tax=Psychroserpens jangbogonensis TaxID=1484460 RepID=UPI00053D37F0|nr:hypothetical protein [Psychroserpens jangbogonensis]